MEDAVQSTKSRRNSEFVKYTKKNLMGDHKFLVNDQKSEIKIIKSS